MYLKTIFMKTFILLVFCLFITNIYAYSLDVEQQTTSNKKDTFYISRYQSKEIFFNITTDYHKQTITNLSNPSIKINLDVLDGSSNIDFILSTNNLIFTNNPSKDFSLKVIPNNYNNQTTRAILSFSLFDEYDNLLDVQKKYFYFVANNSEIQYFTPTGAKPKFLGYDFSKDYLLFRDVNDSFSIDVNFYLESYGTYKYSLVCSSKDLLVNVVAVSDKQNKINVFLDDQKQYDQNRFVVQCFANDKYDSYVLKPISVVVHMDTPSDTIDEGEKDNKSLSSFISLPAFDNFDLKTIMIIIILALLLVIIFSKK